MLREELERLVFPTQGGSQQVKGEHKLCRPHSEEGKKKEKRAGHRTYKTGKTTHGCHAQPRVSENKKKSEE